MNREEFIEKAQQRYRCTQYKKNNSESAFDLLSEYAKRDPEIKKIIASYKIMSFLNEFSDLHLVDISNVPAEWVTKSFVLSYTYRDIKGKAAKKVADIWNSSLVHADYFMDTDGCFYDDNENFITDNTDEFLEFILNLEYTYHPKPSEFTYQMLKDAGWYEGRKEDINDLVKYCKDNGTDLTEMQKKIIAECCGLWIKNPVTTSSYHNSVYFYKNSEHDFSSFRPTRFNNDFKVDAVCVGEYKENVHIYLSSDGRLFSHMGTPYGLDYMEGLHILLNRPI